VALVSFSVIRRVGRFDNVTSGSSLGIEKLGLIYAENARGKTTIAAILRSLSTGDPHYILERTRLGQSGAPEVVIATDSGNAIFQSGSWNAPRPEVTVFDDVFVSENVHSGLEVDPAHRQRLHDLIIGAQGVALSKALQVEIDQIEEHNKVLTKKGDLIPKRLRGDLSPEKFCTIAPIAGLPDQLDRAAKSLAAARDADAVAKRPKLPVISLPSFDVEAINEMLGRSLETLEVDALTRVQQHMRMLGSGGEAWVEDGTSRAAALQRANGRELCPYCAQPLSGSHLIAHYQAYFSGAYRDLKSQVGQMGKEIAARHQGDAVAAFERAVREAVQGGEFWGRFTAVPTIELDTAATVRLWNAAAGPVLDALRTKYVSPLEVAQLPPEAIRAVDAYHREAERIADLGSLLQQANQGIDLVKERAASANVGVLERDLAGLKMVEARYSEEGKDLAGKWLAEKAAKGETEKRRDAARTALETYREQVFPAYEAKLNDYLRRLNAGFRLQKVVSQNSRVGSSASYHVLVNQTAVPLVGTRPSSPSFRTLLSSGDRNALALAFFLASIELDPGKATKVVVFDDPMTSLDEHRTLSTVKEVLGLRSVVKQVIVMSHSKPFLLSVWDDTRKNDPRSAMKVERDVNDTSTLSAWDVTREAVTAHDKRAELVQSYIVSPIGHDERQVATGLRPMLEAFLRVAYPEWFPAGTMLGEFIMKARRALGTADQRMSRTDIDELETLKDYGNLFHHDTNAAYQTQAINDAQLLDFAQRTVAFTRRQP